MRISYFPNNLALNARPVIDSFIQGCAQLGISVVADDPGADAAVIWSLLWAGRMRHNQKIWQNFRDQNKPVIFLEVGMLQRNLTWRLGMYDQHGEITYGHGMDLSRPQKFPISMMPWRDRGDRVVIACQRNESQQWQGMPSTEVWLHETIERLRFYTNREIVVRAHPRQQISAPKGYRVSQPLHISGTYDDFDFAKSIQGAHAVINWNSAPGSLAVMHGIPAFVGGSSLAAPVGNLDLANIENPRMPDRQRWFLELCHTEWTTEELRSGYPIDRLFPSRFG